MVTNDQTKSTQIMTNVDEPLDQTLKKRGLPFELVAWRNKMVTTSFEREQL